MSKKVLLIRPENVYNHNTYPSLGLILIGSQLKMKGYEPIIINCALRKNPLEAIRDELKDTLFIGVTILTSEVPGAYNLIKFIKSHSTVPVIAGGMHCTLFPEQMAASEWIDYVIQGEGEKHITDIAESLSAGGRDYNKIYRKQELNLDSLPDPDYSIDENIETFITNRLTDKFYEYIRQPVRWLPYESSRGCPSRCTFCINTVTNNNRYRKKSAEKVIHEIELIVKKFNISHLKIIDDNFFVDIRRVRDICTGILEKDLNITWDAECRCDYFNDRMLNDETLLLCKRSGLVELTLGIESGSARALRLMKKDITPEQAEYTVMRCNDYGITARSSFMIELPGETIEDIKKTIAFINKLKRYPYFTYGIGTFRPYPKCEMTVKLMEEGYLTEPSSFQEWTKQENIDMYASGEHGKPWQVNSEYSLNAVYYLNIESNIRLGKHQIDKTIDKIKNAVFVFFAKLRNRFMFYGFPIEKGLYKRFVMSFYDKQAVNKKSTERD